MSGGRADCPRLVCYRNFKVLAHAYDNQNGQTIEVSVGLASRAVRDDPLALSILRHEVAHLVHHDLPAIRRESIAAGGAVLSADVVTAMCLLTMIIILAVTDFGKFTLPWSFTNIIEVHSAILLATLIITLPLVLGRYVIRRYASFIFALIEMRADVSAGIWGEGLESLSQRIKNDPDIRPTTVRELGFAYISPSLSHLPAQERASLLSKPARLATPKLSYFAIALGAIWLLNFHQGNEVWDFFLLCAAVALLQGLTVQMIVTARARLRLTPSRAAIAMAAVRCSAR